MEKAPDIIREQLDVLVRTNVLPRHSSLWDL
jgi:hypothetical protein